MTYLHHSVLLLLLLLSPTLLVGIAKGTKVSKDAAGLRPGAAHVHLSCYDGDAPFPIYRDMCGATAIGPHTLLSDPLCFSRFYDSNHWGQCTTTTAVFSFNLDMRETDENKLVIYQVTSHLIVKGEKPDYKYGIFLYTNGTIPEKNIAKPKVFDLKIKNVVVTGWGDNEKGGGSYVRMETNLEVFDRYSSGCFNVRRMTYVATNYWRCGKPAKKGVDGSGCSSDTGGPLYYEVDAKTFNFVGWFSNTDAIFCELEQVNGLVFFNDAMIRLFQKHIKPPPPKVRRENTLLGSPAPSLFFFPLPLVSLALVQFFFW